MVTIYGLPFWCRGQGQLHKTFLPKSIGDASNCGWVSMLLVVEEVVQQLKFLCDPKTMTIRLKAGSTRNHGVAGWPEGS